MATTYKSLSTNDIVTTKTLLHEAIPITGTILSGTYVSGSGNKTELNIKNYTHGMFQSVYDYPYLSSSANHMFDISLGFHADSNLSSSANLNMGLKKINIYNQMAQVLMGYDENGNIRKFDKDGDLTTAGDKLSEVYFLNFSRLLTKDEIKKGSFQLDLGVKEAYTRNNAVATNRIRIADVGAATDYRVNSPAGDYGILYATEGTAGNVLHSNAQHGTTGSLGVGLIYYQAGVVVLSGSIFRENGTGGILHTDLNESIADAAGKDFRELMVSGAISASANALRDRIVNVQFNNTTELNSTVYFCRAHHNEFNYSTNPTYVSSSQIVVKNASSDSPLSYITTVGLYSADNELLAVAKVSEPLKKDPSNELTLRVRLDY